MREASEELATFAEYCQAIYNAESEEEVEYIKQEIVEALRQNEIDEVYITQYMQGIDKAADEFAKGEIVMDENGKFIRNEMPTQESVETNSPQSIATNSQANTPAGIALGLVGAALVVSLAMKKKMLDKKNNRKF